jgi:hypothetical protein
MGGGLWAEQTGKIELLTALLTDCLPPNGGWMDLSNNNKLVGEEGLEPSKS